MEYQVGNEDLVVKIQGDGHADLKRGDTVYLCLSESETKVFLRFVLDELDREATWKNGV